jgi:hypothetical protein
MNLLNSGQLGDLDHGEVGPEPETTHRFFPKAHRKARETLSSQSVHGRANGFAVMGVQTCPHSLGFKRYNSNAPSLGAKPSKALSLGGAAARDGPELASASLEGSDLSI